MSKDNTNLRLLGSPVNLTYRSKKKDDKNNIRNRPRSALQNSCFKPDNQERYKRPFSADTKERPPSTRSFYKAFSSELQQCQSVSCPAVIPYVHPPFPPGPVKTQTIRSDYPLVTTIKVLPPTEDILGNTKSNNQAVKDHCSNASDYGSEDTFISLGTKIKARAQLGTKAKNSPSGKNANRYRNIAKKGRKFMDNPPEDKASNDYGMEIKISDKTERAPSPNRNRDRCERTSSPSFKKRSYDAYFIPVEGSSQRKDEDLSGRVSFGSSNIHTEVEEAIDTYSRRLTLTKQQLSLVEEESTQDVENTSQRMSSLSPEVPLDANKDLETGRETGRNTYGVDQNDEYHKTQNFMQETRTYASFYEDFRSTSFDFKPRTSATGTDVESKDSGYPDSGTNDDKAHKRNFPLPGTSRKSNSFSCQLNRLEDQPKSLESSSSNEKDNYKTFPLDKKSQWAEPMNHSRLLYKDFFLKKEGDLALPPQNSPVKETNIPDINESPAENKDETSDYPPYLLNSTTKAYTSKVIEDYKKELEAINSLHELTLKDIKTDPVSPTPLNIDRMFDQHSSFTDYKQESNDKPQEPCTSDKIKNTLDTKKSDISKVSTKELIQNYLNIKEGDAGKEALTKALKKYEPSKKYTNIVSKIDTNISPFKQDWNNKAKVNTTLVPKPMSIRNQTQKNLFTQPTSARLDSVRTDKDIDSWMSLAAPSPRVEFEPLEAPKETKIEEPRLPDIELYTIEPSPHEKPNPLTKNSLSDPSVSTPFKGSSPPRHTHTSTPRPEQKEPVYTSKSETSFTQDTYRKDLNPNSTVLDIYSMLKEIESYGDNPVTAVANAKVPEPPEVQPHDDERPATPKDNFTEIFEFLEKVEQSANDALNVVTTPGQPSMPKLEALLKLSHTELAQRMVTASLQLEERSCCIALLQESLTNHKEQMIQKISNIEKHSHRNIAKVKLECEEAIKRHQSFIDQLINDKKTLNHRIEQLVDERRSLEERWKRSAQALEERYKLELKNQHDKMVAAQQVARQRWVRQKAEKIKELTVKGLEGELREMAERQQKEVSDLKMFHAEQTGRMQVKHSAELEELRITLEDEKEAALVKERHLASSRLEKQILGLELAHQEQRTRIVAEMRAETDRARAALAHHEKLQREELEKWRDEQEKLILEKRVQLEQEIARERQKVDDQLKQKQLDLEEKFEQFKKDFEAEQQMLLKKKVAEISAQHKQERDREIEKAIESMDAEAQAGRKELQEALRRNKEQYEAELKELAETEQATLRRYQDAQARIRHTEDRCADLEVTITQLETRNKVLTERNIQLEKQLDEIRCQCDKAWQGKVEALQKEMEDMKKTHEEQMHQLYAKVKVAVARKDSAIQALTREAAKYQEKITLLEQKLQQQRKDFLKSK